jgi:hypothetical protein
MEKIALKVFVKMLKQKLIPLPGMKTIFSTSFLPISVCEFFAGNKYFWIFF